LRRTSLTILALSLAAVAIQAQVAVPQASDPLIGEARQAYTSIKTNLIAMAAKVPAEDYAFRATPDVRTFGALIAHVADTQMRTCAGVLGEQKTVDAASKTAKNELVAALQASFDECDAAWDSIHDNNAQQMIGGGRMPRSRLGSLISSVVIHDNEEYGYMSVYLRLKGIVPPSTDSMGRGMGGMGAGRGAGGR
jgi:uncharacterized damage-inducible protein DinB